MNTLAMILAGGEGPGLGVLTALRSEAALPFAGKYRVIDFTLSNCVNSGIYDVAVLTQYEPRSLNEHIGAGRPWDLDRARGVRLLQPYQSRRGESGAWQGGTADAVRFNLDAVRASTDQVLVLAGDHIYKMDYNPLLQFHAEMNADLTLAVRTVSPHDTYRFGMVGLENDGRVSAFEEKPARTRATLASMGVYVFKREALVNWLLEEGHAQHDFGRDVIPALVPRGNVYAYTFNGYWNDVGTVQAYWDANIALLAESPALDLYDPTWVIHTRSEERPAVLIGAEARVDGNLLCDGCQIEGTVFRSVLSPGVYVAPGAVVRDSIVMNDTVVGEGAVLDRVVVDKGVVIGSHAVLGEGDDNAPNRRAPQRLNTGVSIIGKRTRIPPGLHIGRNVEIGHHLPESRFPQDRVESGATILE
jgi:glucose-1-phosphate adenylyltransferase